MSNRQLVLLAQGTLFSQVQSLLSKAGWNVLTAAGYEYACAQGSHGALHAGVIQLSDKASDVDSVENIVSAKPGMEWIALVPPALLANKAICKLLASRFHDFHTLPLDANRLLFSLGHAYGKGRLSEQLDDPLESNGKYGMVGVSTVMRDLYRTIEKISAVDAPVLIAGESGTGKELVAHAIHQLSNRRDAPFVAVNCAALPASLIQAELFGHEKGAFTGAQHRKIGRMEAAAGGTIFLDEIGDLPLDLQVNLLRVLQNQVITRLGSNSEIQLNVRVVAASHVNLEEAIERGRFRQDLYYRLNVLRVSTPALRERTGDVELLANYFFDKVSSQSLQKVRGFSRQALKVMENYNWPGNVRELINKIRRAVIMSENGLIMPADLGLEKRAMSNGLITLSEARERAEQDAIATALRRNQNNVTAAAKQLGISRATLYRLIDRSTLSASNHRA